LRSEWQGLPLIQEEAHQEKKKLVTREEELMMVVVVRMLLICIINTGLAEHAAVVRLIKKSFLDNKLVGIQI
jgi:hypothetical protein